VTKEPLSLLPHPNRVLMSQSSPIGRSSVCVGRNVQINSFLLRLPDETLANIISLTQDRPSPDAALEKQLGTQVHSHLKIMHVYATVPRCHEYPMPLGAD
jgi:hypothetical protein